MSVKLFLTEKTVAITFTLGIGVEDVRPPMLYINFVTNCSELPSRLPLYRSLPYFLFFFFGKILIKHEQHLMCANHGLLCCVYGSYDDNNNKGKH